MIFIGRGEYISDLLIDYFYNKDNIKNYILFKNYNSLDLDIENVIHAYYRNESINEIDLYYNNIQKTNIKFFILKLITMKYMKNIIGDNFRGEFPFQFFRFSLDKNEKLSIEYEFDDIINFINRKIREHLAKLNNFNGIFKSIAPQIKGFIFKELVLSVLLNNKSSLKNLNFTKKNMIEVEDIYDMNNVEKVNDLDSGPIIIVQKTNYPVFDLGIIFDDDSINYFIGGKIDLNKTCQELKEYQEKIDISHESIINNIITLTGRKILEFKFLIMLNKEFQEELQKEYDQKCVKMMENEKYIADYENQYGVKSCNNLNISYLLFSENDFCFYKDGQKVEWLNIYDINNIKKGFDSSSILNEKEKEKSQFENNIKDEKDVIIQIVIPI